MGRLTSEQIEMSRHALGLTEGRTTSYRNHYAAGLGTTQEAAWDDLARQGYALRGDDGIAIVGFCLTFAGASAVLNDGETLDREDFPEIGRTALTEARRERDALTARLAEAERVIGPFIELRDQFPESMKLINKRISGLMPIKLTVTKDQFRAARDFLKGDGNGG
jgi:hypothetical protein